MTTLLLAENLTDVGGEYAMELNTILLLAFVLLMVFCCGGMLMRLGGSKNRPRNKSNESDASKDESSSQDK